MKHALGVGNLYKDLFSIYIFNLVQSDDITVKIINSVLLNPREDKALSSLVEPKWNWKLILIYYRYKTLTSPWFHPRSLEPISVSSYLEVYIQWTG